MIFNLKSDLHYIYTWHGVLNKSLQQGYLAAPSRKSATTTLTQQQIIILSLKKANKISRYYYNNKSIILFFEQLSPLLTVGVPLLASLELISVQLPPLWQRLLYLIQQDINQGEPFSKALSRYNNIFPTLYLHFIKLGEATGYFDECLQYLIQYQRQKIAQKQRVQQALRYPAFMLSSAIILIIVLLLFVLPEMENIYIMSNATLPAITQLLLTISHQFSNILQCSVGLMIMITLLYRTILNKNNAIQHFIFSLLNYTPVINKLNQHAFLSHFFHGLYLLNRVGTPLLQSLETIAASLENNQYHTKLQAMASMLLAGHQLHYSLKQYPTVFPSLCCQLVYIGEESGKLEEMFLKLHEHYHHEMQHQLLKLSNILAPLSTLFIALFIGFIIFAIYMPLFKLGDLLS